MSVLQFVASMVGSLAWPLATVVGFVVFKRPIAALIGGTIGGRQLQRLKLGPAEAEWEKLDQTQHEAASDTSDENSAITGSPVKDPELQELLELASRAPESAVIYVSSSLELELAELLTAWGEMPPDGQPWSNFADAIRVARSADLIDESFASSLRDLRRLRNQVVHGTGEVTRARSALYVLTASEAIQHVRSIARKANPLD